MNIVDRIKILAQSKKMTIAELERATGISNGQIRRWNNSKPSVDKLKIVADYFDVTTDYLLGRTDTPQFSRKNELDVQKTLTELKEGLSNENTLAYLKNDGEEIDENDAKILAEALDFVVRQSKIIAKNKFTRNDYKKNNHNDLSE